MNTIPAWKKQLPMYATYSRIVLAPVLLAILYSKAQWSGLAAAILFILASATDWLDGYWARKFQAESAMGKFMDPIADKILVLGALVMLLYRNDVGPFMVFILVARDVFIGGLRSVAASNSIIISAKPFGKWKTGVQMIAIPCLLINESLLGYHLSDVGFYGLWLSVVLSVYSGFEYTLGYYKGRT